MKFLLLFSLLASSAFAAEVPDISPADAAKLVAAGKAVLVDVREPSEWRKTGVAAPAVLLPKSKFDHDLAGDWKPFLQSTGDKEIILYCSAGERAGQVGAVLAAQGHKVANAGGFNDWQEAGLPVRAYVPAPRS
jgi:rhodanese-related sulfurtransferase